MPKTSAFIGRKADLDLMKEQLMPGEASDRRKICIVHGLGGMGKTQLALEYARLHKVPYTSFFWLDGKTEESLIHSLLLVAPRLPKGQIPDIDTQKITLKGLEESRKAAQDVLQWFALEDNAQWLLIFDNIDKTTFEEEEESDKHTGFASYDISQYFPKSDTGSIIITTRLQRLMSLGSAVPLRKLGVIDGLLILEKHAGRNLRRSHDQESLRDPLGIDEWDPGWSFTLLYSQTSR